MPYVVPIRSALALAFAAFGAFATSCRVDDSLDDQLWPCNPDAPSNECGTKDGRLMTCWQGYCMSSCDFGEPVPEGKMCLKGGALPQDGVLLDTCSPLKDEGCKGELNCYRTDLVNDYGVCVPFRVCDSHDDCSKGVRDNCAGEVLREYLGPDVAFFSDNFQCVAKRCGAGRMDCPTGETCLNETYEVAGRYPDICLPSCDHDEACMPNFACMQSEAAPGTDPICVPGLPGVRCTSDIDCLVGKCADLKVGFSICTIECQNDDDCTHLERKPLYFVCAGEPGGPKHCVNPTPFGGANCNVEPLCPEETPDCLSFSPWGIPQGGECRRPCIDGRCTPRGGLGHACLGEEGGCYPGVFGIPCKGDDECVRPLTCLQVEPDGRQVLESDAICSFECREDIDCQVKDETGGSGYCDGHVCRVPGLPRSPCDRNEQCRSDYCDPREGECT